MSRIQILERELVKILRQLRVADSLLFLSKVLAVQRGEQHDAETELLLARQRSGAPAFVIHLLVKYLMQYGRMNTPFALDGASFPRALHFAFQLAVADPLADSSDMAVHGYFVRMMSQQMDRQIVAQSYGLALGLFQDLDAVTGTKPIDVRREVELAINMPVELFMRLGQAAHGATCATFGGSQLRGTLNLDWLAKAAMEIPYVPWVERWSDFARVMSVNQQGFNGQVKHCSVDDDYAYSHSPLRRHPLIQVASDRFIAVDPHLIVERTSWGVFYDIFEKYQKMGKISAFVEPFGYAFERFVDKLLQSAISAEHLWRETESPAAARIKNAKGKKHKIADLAYRSRSNPVLIEVTSARPTRDFCTFGSEENLRRAAERVVEEIRQLIEHTREIQAGTWSEEGLIPGSWVGLIVTFGRFETINSVFFRKLIDEQLCDGANMPYLVLSLAELDCAVKLVEDGRDFGAVIAQMATEPSFDPLTGTYKEAVQKDAVSSFAKSRTQRMFDFLPADKTEGSE